MGACVFFTDRFLVFTQPVRALKMFKSRSGSDVGANLYVTWTASLERVSANYRIKTIRAAHGNRWAAVFSVSLSDFN